MSSSKDKDPEDACLKDLVVSWVIDARNEVIPPTSYSSGSASRTILDIGCSMFASTFAKNANYSASTNCGTEFGGFRKVHVAISGTMPDEISRAEALQKEPIDSDPKTAAVVVHRTNLHAKSISEWLNSSSTGSYVESVERAIIFADLAECAEESEAGSTYRAIRESVRKNKSPLAVVRSSASLFWSVSESIGPTYKQKRLSVDGTILATFVATNDTERMSTMPSQHATGLSRFDGVPSVVRGGQFAYLRKELANGSDVGMRVKQFVENSAALYGCTGGKRRMLARLDELVTEKKKDGSDLADESVYEALAKTYHDEIKHTPEYRKIHGGEDTKTAPESSNEGGGKGGGTSNGGGGKGGGQSYRYSKRIREISAILPRDFRPRKYLDVGCAEGSITAPLGAHYKLEPSAIVGCDIRDIPTADGMLFEKYDGENLTTHEDGSLDLVTMIMALHHVRNPTKLLTEVVRVLRPGGFLVIREHDCNPSRVALALDIQHGLFAKVWCNPPEWPSFCREYFATYRSREDWTRLIEGTGKMTHLLRWKSQRDAYDPKSRKIEGRNGRTPYITNPGRAYLAVYLYRASSTAVQ
eukprot:g418.t1